MYFSMLFSKIENPKILDQIKYYVYCIYGEKSKLYHFGKRLMIHFMVEHFSKSTLCFKDLLFISLNIVERFSSLFFFCARRELNLMVKIKNRGFFSIHTIRYFVYNCNTSQCVLCVFCGQN
jgi:hypothetical protein